MPEDRRLAAIMFTDIVGYTALMGKDEDRAFQILRKNREIQRPLIKKYRGEWLKEMGDGILASFHTASDAVRCAGEIQQAVQMGGISLRIGIHEGEVVFEGSDVLGDGVNVASRLEELAEEGCINISGAVYKDIKNKAGIKAEFLDEKTLKNVDEPIKVYKVCCEEVEEEKSEISPTKEIESSIAVLPFVNMSNDPEQEYFCDGMSEEIINALSHVESLKVIARTSAFMFKGKHEDMRDIGKKLNVETLLEGSVRKAGNRLRITAQLIRVNDGSHLWSDAYNRELEDVFAIQEEISLAIVDNLKVKLLGKEKESIVKRSNEDLEAYNLLLQGNYYLNKLTTEGYTKAVKYFEQSLQKNPDYAKAYTGLARTYYSSTFYGNMSPNDAYPKAKVYLKKALELDNTLAEAHGGLGFITMMFDRNWNLAEKEFKQAILFNPNSAIIHLYYSWLLTFMYRHNEAIVEINQAKKLNPLSSFINSISGLVYFNANQYDKALEELQMTIEMNPYYFLAYIHIGQVYTEKSMMQEAVEAFKKGVDYSSDAPMTVASLASTYFLLGRKEQSEKLMDGLKKRLKREHVSSSCFYIFYLIQGDQDQAFEWLTKAIDEHDSFLPWLCVSPIKIYRIPDEPRFNELLKKVGLKRRGT